MRCLFTILIVTLITLMSEVTLAQISADQPDFSQQSYYLMWSGYNKDYIAAREEWESIKDDPSISSIRKNAVVTELSDAKEGLARLCSREDFGLSCLSIAMAERGTIEGYIYAERACMAGEDDGCILMAIMLAEGEGRRKDPVQAENILNDNCDPDRLKICRAYATLLGSDQGHPADLPKARDAYKSFCLQMDDLESCKSAFEYLNAGDPKPKTYLTNRLEISRKVCSLTPENAIACNHAKETEEILPLIDLDDCRASSAKSSCASIAVVLEQLAPENPHFKDRIMKLQTYSCEVLRNDQSCLHLVKQDYASALMAPHKSKVATALQSICLNSNTRERYIAEACQWSANLGFTKKSEAGFAEARPFVERLCFLHNPSCNVWAGMLIQGRGGPIDLAKGREFLMMACSASNYSACLDVAKMMYDGIGGEKNPKMAKVLVSDLCNKGEQIACNLRSEMLQGE